MTRAVAALAAMLALITLAPLFPCAAQTSEAAPPSPAVDAADKPQPPASVREAESTLQAIYKGRRIGEPLAALLPPDGEPLFQLDALLAALRVEHTTEADGSVKGRLYPGDSSFHFGIDGGYSVGWLPGSLDRKDYAVVDGMLLVSVSAVQRLLPVRAEVNKRRLTMTIQSDGPLPLDLERQRLAQRERLDDRVAQEEPPISPFPYSMVGRPFGDVRVQASAGSTGSRRYDLAYDGLLSGELGYATALLFYAGSHDEPLRDARFRIGREAPYGDAFGVPGMTSAFIGDVRPFSVPLLGAPGAARGFVASSFPLDRPDSFDRTAVEGDAPPGWDVELYRGAQLLGFQRVRPDGRYRFEDVNLEFGDNPLRVVLYGPEGQVREEVRRFQVGSGMAPPGRMFWRGFVGQPNRRLLEALLPKGTQVSRGNVAYSAEIEAGLTSFLTAHAFVSSQPELALFDSAYRTTYGGGLRVSAMNVYLEGDVAQQDPRGQAWRVGGIAGYGGVSLSARHAHYQDFLSVEASRGLTPLRSASSARVSYTVPIPGLSIGLDSGVERYVLANGATDTSVRGAARFSLWRFYFDHAVDMRRYTYAGGGQSDTLYYKPTVSTNIGGLRLAASARIDTKLGNVDEYLATASYRIDRRTYTSVTASRLSIFDGSSTPSVGYTAAGSLTRDFGPFYGSISAVRDANGGIFVGLGLNMSFGVDRGGRLAVSSQPMANFGSAEAFVYQDRNGNGRFDPSGDTPLRNTRMRVNGYVNTEDPKDTDEDGRVFLSGFDVTRPVTIGIDQASLPDPFLTPATNAVRFVPRPGQPRAVEFAVSEAGEISGFVTLRRGQESVPLAGVVVELVRSGVSAVKATTSQPGLPIYGILPWLDEDRGTPPSAQADGTHVVSARRSQLDGLFMFDQVPPGEYMVRVRPGQKLRGTELGPIQRNVVLRRDSLTVQDADLELKTATEAAQTGGNQRKAGQ